eukprot:TRINITY_DN45286_c0_g1_i1.p1 TRINITY_DN45286_c0_g1~~TRINITY_DN45286_c0_g1_i1.p1  ORF type:complete len:261 (+),score=57.61 TRINITY_DN45286_c0_g1_i1:84-866(+)
MPCRRISRPLADHLVARLDNIERMVSLLVHQQLAWHMQSPWQDVHEDAGDSAKACYPVAQQKIFVPKPEAQDESLQCRTTPVAKDWLEPAVGQDLEENGSQPQQFEEAADEFEAMGHDGPHDQKEERLQDPSHCTGEETTDHDRTQQENQNTNPEDEDHDIPEFTRLQLDHIIQMSVSHFASTQGFATSDLDPVVNSIQQMFRLHAEDAVIASKNKVKKVLELCTQLCVAFKQGEAHVCTKCGRVFKNSGMLDMHLRDHG